MTHDCERHMPSTTCYQKCQCRCDECRAARSKYAKKWRLMKERKIDPYVDAAPARKHVEMLMRCGMSHGTVAIAAGMENSGLSRLLGVRKDAPPAKRIRRDTERRILAVKYTNTTGVSLVDATAAKRRLQDLALRGFGAPELGDLCGIEYHSLRVIRSGERRSVRVETANAIEIMHRHLEGKEPVTTSLANRNALIAEARRRGYGPLASWDNINNPLERAKGVA